MNKAKKFIGICIIIILLISFIGHKGELIENVEIPAGTGTDIEKISGLTYYDSSILVYFFNENEMISNVLVGRGKTIAESRENRQLTSGKKSLIGLNKVNIISEDAAINGVKSYLDIVLNNPMINDRAMCVICKGKAENILKYKAKGYASSVELIEGMEKSLVQYNFFPMQYSLMDMIVRADAEGRNVILPYIEITDKGIETTGIAIFKKYNMVGKAGINETKLINILGNSNVKGMLTVQKESDKFINCYSESKRKVKCYKDGNKYRYVIDLNIKGDIVSNELYTDFISDKKKLNAFEKEMKNHIEKMLNESINKIKCEYKVDILDLGRYAAAKYGRSTGTDWNKVFCDSEIKVNVKFSIDTEGRGDY